MIKRLGEKLHNDHATPSLTTICPHCQHSTNEPQLEVISRRPTAAAKNFPPLLFVHGGWHTARCWDEYFLPFFAEQGYECHAVSLRGHGGSGGKENVNWHRVADFVRDICRVASNLSEPPVIVAHSFGGFHTARYLAHHRPAAVALLTPIPPTGLWPVTLKWAASHPWRFLTANLTLNPREMVDSPAVAKEFFFSESMAHEKLQKFYSQLDNESYMAFLDGLFLKLPQRPRSPCPMIVIGAEHDRLIRPKDNRFTADFFGAELRYLEGIAHDVMLEDSWQKAANALLEFFSSVAASKQPKN